MVCCQLIQVPACIVLLAHAALPLFLERGEVLELLGRQGEFKSDSIDEGDVGTQTVIFQGVTIPVAGHGSVATTKPTVCIGPEQVGKCSFKSVEQETAYWRRSRSRPKRPAEHVFVGDRIMLIQSSFNIAWESFILVILVPAVQNTTFCVGA